MRTTEPRGAQAYPCRGDAATGLAKETAADEPIRACVMSFCPKPVEEVGGIACKRAHVFGANVLKIALVGCRLGKAKTHAVARIHQRDAGDRIGAQDMGIGENTAHPAPPQ